MEVKIGTTFLHNDGRDKMEVLERFLDVQDKYGRPVPGFWVVGEFENLGGTYVWHEDDIKKCEVIA